MSAALCPRARRVLAAPLSREALDRIAGASNSPDIVRRLRGLGVGIACRRLKVRDRDGRIACPGEYHLTERDRALLLLGHESS